MLAKASGAPAVVSVTMPDMVTVALLITSVLLAPVKLTKLLNVTLWPAEPLICTGPTPIDVMFASVALVVKFRLPPVKVNVPVPRAAAFVAFTVPATPPMPVKAAEIVLFRVRPPENVLAPSNSKVPAAPPKVRLRAPANSEMFPPKSTVLNTVSVALAASEIGCVKASVFVAVELANVKAVC